MDGNGLTFVFNVLLNGWMDVMFFFFLDVTGYDVLISIAKLCC